MGKLSLLSIDMDPDWSVSMHLSAAIVIISIVATIAYLGWKVSGSRSWRSFEIDQAEIGIGSGKVTLKPNMTDRQVAYSIWVELSTRKIGLKIDFDHDVVAEIYDSWHTFFSVTRELIKSVPVGKVRQDSTQKIIQLSIEILNDGLRPHLTRWQARFRRWYDKEVERINSGGVIDPQDIQKNFPRWQELKTDMERVNGHLIAYRRRMDALVHSD